jgi:hypothetical protein
MKLLYVFKERAPIFIEIAWRISLSSASRLLAWSKAEEVDEAIPTGG